MIKICKSKNLLSLQIAIKKTEKNLKQTDFFRAASILDQTIKKQLYRSIDLSHQHLQELFQSFLFINPNKIKRNLMKFFPL